MHFRMRCVLNPVTSLDIPYAQDNRNRKMLLCTWKNFLFWKNYSVHTELFLTFGLYFKHKIFHTHAHGKLVKITYMCRLWSYHVKTTIRTHVSTLFSTFFFPLQLKMTHIHIIEGKCKQFLDKQREKAIIWVGRVTINATNRDKYFTAALFVSEKIVYW